MDIYKAMRQLDERQNEIQNARFELEATRHDLNERIEREENKEARETLAYIVAEIANAVHALNKSESALATATDVLYYQTKKA